MLILIACEFSGIVRTAFEKLGWDAWSIDLLPTEKPGKHLQADILDVLDDVRFKGFPQVVTDYTTTQELIIEDIQTGEAVKLAGDEVSPEIHTDEILNGTLTGSWNVERGIISVSDCLIKLNKLYYDKKLRKQYSINCLKKVKKYYSWDKIIPVWKKVLKEMIT